MSLPRMVPPSLTSRYISKEGPRPIVLKLPASPPNKYNIPVHYFLRLPDDGKGGDTMPMPEETQGPRPIIRPGPEGDSKPQGSSNRGSRISLPRRKSSLKVTRREKDEDDYDHERRESNMSTNSGLNSPSTVSVHSKSGRPTRTSGAILGISASMVDLSTPSLHSIKKRQRPPATPTPTFATATQWQRHKRKVLNLPVLIDFHGGSFILGSPSEQAFFCAQMARNVGRSAGCVVLSVDYRLGPYSRFPAANEDAEDVVRAVLNPDSMGGRVLREDIRRHADELGRKEWIELDTSRIAFSGFSSGGNLALNLVINSFNDPTLGGGRDWPSVVPGEHPRPVPVLLFYPSLDARLLPDERPRPKGLDAPTGFFASLKIETQLMPKYLPKEKRGHPRASPGLVDVRNGGLHDQARMLLVLPELDSLSSQSQDWVRKVRVEGGRGQDLEVIDVKGEMHGWTQFPENWLKTEESKRRKNECFERAERFLRYWWHERDEREQEGLRDLSEMEGGRSGGGDGRRQEESGETDYVRVE